MWEIATMFLMWFALAATLIGVWVLTDRWLDQRKFEKEMRERHRFNESLDEFLWEKR